MAVGNRCADHVTPLYPQKLALTSPTGGGRSVGIVRSRTKATDFSLVFSIVTNFFAYLQIWLEFGVLVVCNVICCLGSLRIYVEKEVISLRSLCLQCLHLLRFILVTICFPVHIA